MFNAGSLLEHPWFASGSHKQQGYRVIPNVVEYLHACRVKHGIHIALYAQEDQLDAVACALLARLVDDHSDVFDLGWGWGALEPSLQIQPSWWCSKTGLGVQAYLGQGWSLAQARSQFPHFSFAEQ